MEGTGSDVLQVFLQQQRRLEAYVRRFIACRETAADLAQDAFLRLWHRRDRLSGHDPTGYLFRTAHNLSIDHLRAQRVQREHRVWQAAVQPNADTATPEAEAAALEELQALEAVLLRLPARTRQVFLWNRVEGRTYGEIAAALGISASAVEKHMLRALADCRACLAARR